MSDLPAAPPDSPRTDIPAATDAPARVGRRAPPSAAPTLFEEANVLVSTERVVVYGTPFPLADTSAVRLFIDKRHLRFAVPILIAGIALGVYGIATLNSPKMAVAFMLIVVSYLTYRFQTLRHKLLLVRSTGETEVLASSDLSFVERVKRGIEEALKRPAAPSA